MSSASTAAPNQPANLVRAASLNHLWAALLLGLSFGAYFTLRYLGYWADSDTAEFARTIYAFMAYGHIDHPGAYTHGYAYSVWAATLTGVTGIPLSAFLEVYGPMLGNLLLALGGYACFRRLLVSDALGLAAGATLFLVPELFFTVSRGNHEKLTVYLTLLAAMTLLASFTTLFRGEYRLFMAWVITYYLLAFTLVSLNVLFGSTMITASTLTLLLTLPLSRLLNRRDQPAGLDLPEAAGPTGNPTGRLFSLLRGRLGITVGASWVLVALVTWYLYPAAGTNLALLQTALQKLSALFLSFQPSSNPYQIIGGDWVSTWTYRWLSSFRWLLFAGSFLCWVGLLWRAWRQPENAPPEHVFLMALYGAFGIQLALAVPVDLLNLGAGTNLQVRIYTYFALFAAPMFALGVARLATQLRPRLGSAVTTGLLALIAAAFVPPSLLKATLDPAVSNRWLFYWPAEISALRFWDVNSRNAGAWIGASTRLGDAYSVKHPPSTPLSTNTFYIDRSSGREDFVLNSIPLRANVVAWKVALPYAILGDRVYDNGDVQLLSRVPSTPFQR